MCFTAPSTQTWQTKRDAAVSAMQRTHPLTGAGCGGASVQLMRQSEVRLLTAQHPTSRCRVCAAAPAPSDLSESSVVAQAPAEACLLTSVCQRRQRSRRRVHCAARAHGCRTTRVDAHRCMQKDCAISALAQQSVAPRAGGRLDPGFGTRDVHGTCRWTASSRRWRA